MNKLLQQIELIERIDQLIRLKATGTPKTFAKRLTISEASLYRLIDTIKEMGAPVEFSVRYQSYIYANDVNFICGFFLK
ncbi:MAG: HTH domain-containing protein [Prolixibacteraceae bacterium]|jgi:predicted DNA-binding transcriptional regulator YafY